MKKTITVLAALTFTLGITGSGLAADDNRVASCEVMSIEGKKVVLKCGEDAGLLEVGNPVRITPQKKRANIEGC